MKKNNAAHTDGVMFQRNSLAKYSRLRVHFYDGAFPRCGSVVVGDKTNIPRLRGGPRQDPERPVNMYVVHCTVRRTDNDNFVCETPFSVLTTIIRPCKAEEDKGGAGPQPSQMCERRSTTPTKRNSTQIYHIVVPATTVNRYNCRTPTLCSVVQTVSIF